VIRSYTKVQGYQVEVLVTNPGTEQQTVRVAYSAPDRLRVESKSGTGIVQMTPNAGPEQMTDYKGRAEGVLAPAGYRDYTSIENNMESVRLLRQEDITLDGVPVACTVVEGRYSHGIRRTFWVDAARYVVLREVDLVPGKGSAKGTEVEHTIAVQALIWNQSPPDSLFVPKLKSGLVLPKAIGKTPNPVSWRAV
jgi:outer membrane lipoprotein-sorting protein